ncbi:Uncharacterised protein [Enterobacter cloacae]|nr:Uncharacterised protein [Enterobacter cloacae]
MDEIQYILMVDAVPVGPMTPGTLHYRQRIHQRTVQIKQKTFTLHTHLRQALMIC